MENIYCISGLGADHRLFGKLELPGYQLIHLPWVRHDDADNMATYAAKMSACISEENPVILGLSMGGMIATEISKTRPTRKIVLVSSARTGDQVGERPFFVKWAGIKGVVPARLLNIPFPFVLDSLGAKTPDERALLTAVVQDSNPEFMKWAFKAVLSWDNTTYPENTYHIHGTADKVIYPETSRPDVWVEGGSHIMILNRAQEVASLILQYLLH